MKFALILSLILSGLPVMGEVVDPRRLYVIDGDTVDNDGRRYRLVGFDTPEIYNPDCDYEKELGRLAKERLIELLDESRVELTQLPGQDYYGRYLGRLLVNGVDVGAILIQEGLARPYPYEREKEWCAT